MGVRFIEDSGVIYPQIQTGKLLPFDLIDESTIEWQKLPIDRNYSRAEYHAFSEGQFTNVRTAVTRIQFEKFVIEKYVWGLIPDHIEILYLKLYGKNIDYSSGEISQHEDEFVPFKKGEQVEYVNPYRLAYNGEWRKNSYSVEMALGGEITTKSPISFIGIKYERYMILESRLPYAASMNFDGYILGQDFVREHLN